MLPLDENVYALGPTNKTVKEVEQYFTNAVKQESGFHLALTTSAAKRKNICFIIAPTWQVLMKGTSY